MLEQYERPLEMPEIFVDDAGIATVNFDTIVITAEHIVYGAGVLRKLHPGQKFPIMVVGQVAQGVEDKLSKIGRTPWVADVTSALAVVAQARVGLILGNIFMKLQRNPYPTKIFTNEVDAKAWLMEYTNK